MIDWPYILAALILTNALVGGSTWLAARHYYRPPDPPRGTL